MTRLRGTPVTNHVLRRADVAGLDLPDRLDIPGCGFDPAARMSRWPPNRDAVITQPQIFAAAGVDVTAHDRIACAAGSGRSTATRPTSATP